MRIDYSKELNPEQYEAVTATEGPVLIIAGAGSGKTRVITFRIAYMLERGIPQSAILALTFTNKAAREMANRAQEITGRKLRDLTVSTFHSFGVKILRKEIHLLGWKDNFSIYDETDKTQTIKDCARELGFTMEGFDAYKVGQIFSDVACGRAEWAGENDAYKGLFAEYRRALKIFNAVDFDDLISMPVDIFARFPEVRQKYRERFCYIMIDEFQDTSSQQYEFMHMIAGENVCVVGDDDQSIYSWRGANYENLLRFERDYPAVKEIKLERNYRSTSTILTAANAIIANNTNRKVKNLWSPSGKEGTPIELVSPEDDRQEAEYISRSIKEIRLRENKPWEEFGILIRTNSLSRQLEESLMAAGLPYRITGGPSFYSRKEIRDVISYLRVVANPDDDTNFVRIVNTPRRGIGKSTLEKLVFIARAHSCSLRSAVELLRSGALSELSGKSIVELCEFMDLIESFREQLLGKKRIAQAVRAMIDRIDYWGYLVEEHKTNDKVAVWKFRNIELLLQSMEDWEKDPDNLSPGLYEWLSRVSLVNRDDDKDGEGKVNLMTIHSAKGLEFDVVFLAGCEDGIVPHARAIEEGEGNLEEERRLFYVAVTRARQKLVISSCLKRRNRNQIVDCAPSPFLLEIPAGLTSQPEIEGEFTEEEGAACFDRLKAMFGPA